MHSASLPTQTPHGLGVGRKANISLESKAMFSPLPPHTQQLP